MSKFNWLKVPGEGADGRGDGAPQQGSGLDVPLTDGFIASMDEIEQAALAARLRPRLEAELAEIDRLDAENAGWSAPVELDQQSVGRVSRIDAMQMQAMSQPVRRRRAGRRVALQQALKRIDEGEFGFCVECGNQIAPARLDVDPTFAACVRCAR